MTQPFSLGKSLLFQTGNNRTQGFDAVALFRARQNDLGIGRWVFGQRTADLVHDPLAFFQFDFVRLGENRLKRNRSTVEQRHGARRSERMHAVGFVAPTGIA